MPAFNGDIRKLAKVNQDFRREILTNARSQAVLMRLRPGEDIGEEAHAGNDQLLVVAKGKGEVRLDDAVAAVGKASLVPMVAGTRPNLLDTDIKSIHRHKVYSPPETPPGTVHAIRAEAMAARRSRKSKREKPLIQRISNAQGESA